VLGLGTVVGWTTWRSHQDAQAEALSMRYQALVDTAALPNHSGAVELADAIIADDPQSSYAALAALVGAHSAFKAHDISTTRRMLEWAIANASGFQVNQVARVRLARILTAEGNHDDALTQLDAVTDASFAAVAAEARGDVLKARGDADAARAAYEGALAAESITPQARERIQLKIETLAS
jgi:predicted negative regulator of RcsB-dependent stress response